MIKRAVFVINKVSRPGGAERVISVLCSEFVKRNIDVTLIVQESMERAYPLDALVKMVNTSVKVNIPILRPIIRQVKLRNHLRCIKPDIIISFMTDMNVLTLLASLGLRIPVIVSERNDPNSVKGFLAFCRDLIYPLAKGFVFQTDDAKEYFSESIKERSKVIPNPLSPSLPNRTTTQPIYEIVSVGRLERQKNQELLLKAFAEFKKTHSNYNLKIYGTGALKKYLENIIQQLGISDSVTLMGAVPNVTDRIYNADMFVFTSDFEGMPNALAEALAIGIPCISTDCPCGGPKYLIDNEVNGILVPVNNREKVVAAMCRLADDFIWAEQLGSTARKHRCQLNAERIADEWIVYCEKVCEEHINVFKTS